MEKYADIQFYATLWGECTIKLAEEQNIEWWAKSKATGAETQIGVLKGPQIWDPTTDRNSDYPHIFLVPMPSLYTATEDVWVYAKCTAVGGKERVSGWINGRHYCNKEAYFNSDDDWSEERFIEEDVSVTVNTNYKTGDKIIGKRDKDEIETEAPICVGSTLNLKIDGEVDAEVTVQWQTLNATTSQWDDISGENGLSYSEIMDKSIISSAANGVTKSYRAEMKDPEGQVKYHYFEVRVFWAEKLIVGSTGVTPAEAVTIGVCEGTEVTMTGVPQYNKGSYNDQELEYYDKDNREWVVDDYNAPTKTGNKVSVSFTVDAEGFNEVPMRFKSIYKTGINNYICFDYSDTVTLYVNTLEKGEIKTANSDGKLCSGIENELYYEGDGDTFEWYFNNSATVNATGKSVKTTPTKSPWPVKVKVTKGTGAGACTTEVSKSFTLKDCGVTLSIAPLSFCAGDVPTGGVTLTLSAPYAVTALYVSPDNWSTDKTLTSTTDYDASTAATDGKIKLTSTYLATLTAGTYSFVADISGAPVDETDEVSLTVNALPTLSNLTTTTNGAVCEKDDLTFETPATASNGDITAYQWYYAATQAAANAHTGTAVTADANTSGHTAKKLTLKTTGLSSTLNGRWYYAKVTAKNSSTQCTAEDYTVPAEAKVNPVPDTTGIVAAVKIGGASGTTLKTCAGSALDMEVTTNAKAGYTYSYQWKRNNSTTMPSGVTGGNTAKLSFTGGAAATANNGDYTLTITVDNDVTHCKSYIDRKLNVQFVNCTGDKLSDAGGTNTYGKNNAYSVCENDNDAAWPYVRVVAGFETAAISGITLYHSTTKNGTYAPVSPAVAAPNYNFNVKSAGTTYTATGSHYYYAKLDRTGYASTYTDTAEYVVGALPDYSKSGLAAAKAMGKSQTTLGVAVDGPVADLTLCDNLAIVLSTDNMPATGNDATVESGIPNDNNYYWYKGTTATVPERTDVTSPLNSTATFSMPVNNNKRPAADGTPAYYYIYRQYKRDTKINSTGANKTCTAIFKVGNPVKVTVNPMPTKPTAIAGATKDKCSGDTVILTTATTPATAPTGSSWTYRWLKNDVVDMPAFGTAALTGLTPGVSKTVTNSGTTVAKETYKLRVYAATTAGCTDSVDLGSITVNINPRPTITAPTITAPSDKVCVGKTLDLTASGASTTTGTLVYQWYKMAGATPDTTTDTKVVATSGKYSLTTNKLTVTGVEGTSGTDGKYYARVVVGGQCPAAALSTNQVPVNVKPLPQLGDAFTVTTCNLAGYSATICNDESEAQIVITPKTGAPYDGYTYTYSWNKGTAVTGQGGNYRNVALTTGTTTYTATITATSTDGGCTKDTA